jgi:hypothetical protein
MQIIQSRRDIADLSDQSHSVAVEANGGDQGRIALDVE